MSARRWGIGLVTALFAAGTAFLTFCLALFIAIGLCDYNYSDVEQGSTTDAFCSSSANSVFYIAYLALPTLLVIVGGGLGIRSQRWRRLWLGVALATVLLIAGPVVVAALPNA